MPARSRISPPASTFSMWPLRPSVMTWGCSRSRSWSGTSPCLRSDASRFCSSRASPYCMRPSCRTAHLRIDREAVDRVEGLAHGFVEGRVGVDGLHHDFDGGFGFHGG